MSTQSESDTGATTVDGEHSGPATGEAGATLSRRRAALSWLRGHRAGVGVGALGALAVASVAAATGVYFTQYRPDQQTDEAAQRAATAAATDGSVAILSYAPDTLDHDLTTAKSFLTGDFLTYYGQFTQQVVAPAAKQKSVKTSAAVVRSAVEQIRPDSAVVLVFINQTTTTSDKPDPSMTSSSVKVSLSHVDGKWLISSFDPV
ncbi:twin-arginine translocation pathway signal [Nocardia aobensis]|uniref:Twin-arginine translocation pathway signal n=1 Tax=Nocardia aobensis TaxID=257277 RepID=A0ABW6PDC9_9NOCA